MALLLFCVIGLLLIKNYSKWTPAVIITNTLLAQFVYYNQSVFAFLSIFIIVLFFIKYKNIGYYIKEFPFKCTIGVFFLSMCVSNFMAMPENRHTPTLFVNICQTGGLIFVLWYLYLRDSKYTLDIFVQITLLFGGAISLYSLYETLTVSNPFITYFSSLEYFIPTKMIEEVRFGLKRSQGIFSMHTTLGGVVLNIYAVLLIAYKVKYIHSLKLLKSVIVLCFVTVFLTGARSCMIGICLCSLMLCSNIGKQIKYSFLYLSLLLLTYVFVGGYICEILNSIFYTDNIEGSNVDMREGQFLISLGYMFQSPIYGNGIGYLWDIVQSDLDSELYGAESIWFNVIADYGILGLVSYTIIFLAPAIYSWKKDNKCILFYIFGCLTINTMSSIPGVQPILMIAYVIIINALLDWEKQNCI